MEQFATPAPIAVVLGVPAGRIRLIAADREDTVVEVLPADRSKGRDADAARRALVSYEAGVLRVEIPEGKRSGLIGGSAGAVEVTVRTPAGSRVEAVVADAEFRGVGRLGEVVLEAARAEVKLDEAEGARLMLQAGDVAVGRLGGPARIGTQKGDVRIAEAVGGEVALETGYGEIVVGVARGVSASLDAGTGHGRVRNSLNNTAGPSPALTLRATTGYGDITAHSL
ncbi:hypothetical protein AB0O18_09535 [Streptomyces sp. NPDC093224]|uniref:hypothetical protein n=1 Tax=Streptomyces sp. NPDC093224 TaxID=3155198 RepID=UPI003431B621